ncbi:MAG: DUF2177 family protein [Candidatus Izemoplasmatales bacterium]|uniref:DUF2177 family protein n=1 Tax=Hujiaoplasma nucleasis TaxID=2725268 RepID=A0A7L6N614_9MOLU|nr:DUF2177 family protein [Hujiaoplasma nucleasis]QLY40688.1 DUF2177 family protein [Hujiaoplasma nucleasis]
MEFGNFMKMYLIAFIVFLAIDALWLGLIATKFYKTNIGHLMAEKPNFIAAGIFYLLFIIGVVFFTYQGIAEQNFSKALLAGAVFGFMTYATYDLTNLATLKDWPIMVTVVDLLWGTFLSSAMTTATYFIYHAIF